MRYSRARITANFSLTNNPAEEHCFPTAKNVYYLLRIWNMAKHPVLQCRDTAERHCAVALL